MYNRYYGNSGRVQRIQEGSDKKAPAPKPRKSSAPFHGEKRERPGSPAQAKVPVMQSGGFINNISGLLGRRLGELETDDLIILLILYLMYRESGDTELLIIMGAMFFL